MSISILRFIAELTADSELAIEHTCNEDEFRSWWMKLVERPADVFAVAISLAQRSLAYAAPHLASRAGELEAKARAWDSTSVPPDSLREIGDRLFACRDTRCDLLPDDLRRLILELVTISDCAWGHARRNLGDEDRLRLGRSSSLSRLDPQRVRVLPKFRTPQVGLTVRSWSHHLAAIASEVPVTYVRSTLGLDDSGRDRLRLLVYPWPFVVAPGDFRTFRTERRDVSYFEFSPPASPEDKAIARFQRLLKSLPPIDLVVLPEAALSDGEYMAWKRVAADSGCAALLAGVRADQRNQVRYDDLRYLQTVTQHKHHRWKLDESQIGLYELGGQMAPHKTWWEHILVGDKSLMVIDTGEFSMVPLICEDLARQEPIAPVIRTLGPSLVVALLLDGPQLESRWSARYATVLAEDPGCSVLTVSSLGMVCRSKPPPGKSPSRSIGLWRSQGAALRCLELPPDREALVLTVCKRPHRETSADGRSSSPAAGLLYLADVTPVSCPEP